jgi:hypothetical protein
MSSQMNTDLNPELISKLDSHIDSNKPGNRGQIPLLSNHQMPVSIANLQKVRDIGQPSFADAGEFTGGYQHCIYYKHSNGNIYVMRFWLQEFDGYYLLADFEPQLKDYIPQKKR